MVGGAHDPGAVTLPDDRLLALVQADLLTTMGLSAAPRFLRIFRHPRGIPQYTVGHYLRLREVEDRLTAHPGLFACGNSYRGISVNACVEDAPKVAEAVLHHLTGREEPVPGAP